VLKNVLCCLAMLVSAVSYSQPLRTAVNVDLNRYAGTWYEIARLPNRFQVQCIADVTAQYRKREDGRIVVINRCKKADGSMEEATGLARIMDPINQAKLSVRFAPTWLAWLPYVWGDYWILELAADYSVAVVGEPGLKYLWILSRTPSIPDATYAELLSRLAEQNYKVSAIVKTPQHP
jgi:apolipoprotein D and lipocalin family protein